MKNALVLGGGGGKGAYQVGVWRALRELGVEKTFACVLGTSVGALNAALFAQGKLDQAEVIWRALSPDQMLPPRFRGDALASQRGIRDLLLQNMSLMSGDLSTYVCCSKIVSGNSDEGLLGVNLEEVYRAEYFRLNALPPLKQISCLLASSALPLAYGKVEINGAYYRDGGLIPEHNLPYHKAADLGYRCILAVSLDAGISNELSCGGAQVFVLYPSQPLGGLLDGTLDFDPEGSLWRMQLGYHDAMAQRDRIRTFCGFKEPKSKSFPKPSNEVLTPEQQNRLRNKIKWRF